MAYYLIKIKRDNESDEEIVTNHSNLHDAEDSVRQGLIDDGAGHYRELVGKKVTRKEATKAVFDGARNWTVL